MEQTNISICIAGSRHVPFDRQDQVYRFSPLLDSLRKTGYLLSRDPKSDWLICINHNKTAYRKFISAGGSAQRAILLRDEPVSVFPSQFETHVENLYSLVLTPGLSKNLSRNNFFIPWPYEVNANPNTPSKTDSDVFSQIQAKNYSDTLNDWAAREKHIVIISSNKVSPKKSVFHEFRRAVAHNAHEFNAQIYGDLWSVGLKKKLIHRLGVLVFAIRNRSRISFRSIYGNLHWRYQSCGSVDNKFDVLLNSRMSIVLENSNSTVSEKIFDVIIAGCVPIYVGPKLSSIELPEDLAIQCEPDIDSLRNLLQNLSEERVEMVRQSGQDFIQSHGFKTIWSSEGVNSQLYNLILQQMKSIIVNGFIPK